MYIHVTYPTNTKRAKPELHKIQRVPEQGVQDVFKNRNVISKKWLPWSMIPCSKQFLDILPPTGKEMVSICSIAFDVSFVVKIHIIESM